MGPWHRPVLWFRVQFHVRAGVFSFDTRAFYKTSASSWAIWLLEVELMVSIVYSKLGPGESIRTVPCYHTELITSVGGLYVCSRTSHTSFFPDAFSVKETTGMACSFSDKSCFIFQKWGSLVVGFFFSPLKEWLRVFCKAEDRCDYGEDL